MASAEIMNWPPGSHASTFGGNPVSCMAALETIELLQQGLMDNAVRVGEHLQNGLRQLMARHPQIADVRGLGLMVGVELVHDRTTLTPAPELRDAIVQACFQRGLLLLGCGLSTIRFCPPLTISTGDVDVALRIMNEAIKVTILQPLS